MALMSQTLETPLCGGPQAVPRSIFKSHVVLEVCMGLMGKSVGGGGRDEDPIRPMM